MVLFARSARSTRLPRSRRRSKGREQGTGFKGRAIGNGPNVSYMFGQCLRKTYETFGPSPMAHLIIVSRLQPFDVLDELTERLDALGIIEFPEVDAEPVLEFAN